MPADTATKTMLPRDNLFRVMTGGVEVREAGEGEAPVLHGHFAVFNQWTEIDSVVEGNFMERIAPGAFTKTFQETQPKVLFQHGHDPVMGDQVLGLPRTLEQDETGAAYEVDMFDGTPPLIMAGLRAGAYGSSFRFRVLKESVNDNPDPSEANPEGIRERTVMEAAVPEFGPVTFPAYEGATAGMRSLTDRYMIEQLASDPERFRSLLDLLDRHGPAEEPPAEEEPDEAAVVPHSVSKPAVAVRQRRFTLDRGVTRWKLR